MCIYMYHRMMTQPGIRILSILTILNSMVINIIIRSHFGSSHLGTEPCCHLSRPWWRKRRWSCPAERRGETAVVVPRRDRGGRAPPRSASSYMKKGSGGETAVVVPRRDRPRIAAWSTSGRRLCSPGLPVRRDGQLWLSIPLRCETSVQCSDSHYFYDGWQKDPQETVV